MTVRVAMWSGPRNISTAMMRAFGARPDTSVCDEPFYAHYLRETGLVHPMREEVLAEQSADWRVVVDALTGPVPGGRGVWYQKHMAHHMLPGIDRSFLAGFREAFLIREPRAMLASLVAKLGDATLEETGLPQQLQLFHEATERHGARPAVVDAADVQRDPAGVLAALCGALDIEWTDAMLAWERGPHPDDGCWGVHWYGNTNRSTGFMPHVERPVELPARYEDVARACEAIYDELGEGRIRPTRREETAR